MVRADRAARRRWVPADRAVVLTLRQEVEHLRRHGAGARRSSTDPAREYEHEKQRQYPTARASQVPFVHATRPPEPEQRQKENTYGYAFLIAARISFAVRSPVSTPPCR